MAEAAAQGARDAAHAMEDATLHVRLVRAEDVQTQDVLQSDGYVFCAPENLAALTGEMKAFFDRHYYAVLDAVAGRPYAAIIAAGTDGQGALRQLQRIATGWRLRETFAPIVARNGAQTPEAILAPKTVDEATLAQCRESGGTLAATLLL